MNVTCNKLTHITPNKLKYLPENQDHLFFSHVKTKLEAFLLVFELSVNYMYDKCGCKLCVTTGNKLF